MQVEINEQAAAIIRKLMSHGQFQSVQAAVNSLILKSARKKSQPQNTRRPDPVTAAETNELFPSIPRSPGRVVDAANGSQRLPEFLESE